MANDVNIKIKAEDSASSVMDKIGASAKKMSGEVDTGAEKASRSLDDFKSKATAVGAGFGALVTASSLAGRAYLDQERSIASLRRTYGDATDQLVDFADEIQRTTTFSNDAAREAESIFGTLARNYGLTATQVQELTQRTADLAAATGFTLPDAAERVAAAIRGEAESAEALGLTMNQQAIDRDNLTLTMSNQEAAQFRLNALYDQSAFAEGAAAERASTLAGKTEQLVNRGQDLIQSMGGAIGPIGQVTAVLGNAALAAPLAGAGIGKVAAAAQALAKIGPISGLLGLATGPVGIVTAAGVATVALYKLADAMSTSFAEDAEKATDAANNLTTALNELAAASDPKALTGQSWSQAVEDMLDVDDDFKRVRERMTEIEDLIDELHIGPQSPEKDVAAFQRLRSEYDALDDAISRAADFQNDLTSILLATGPAADAAREETQKYLDGWRAGHISLLAAINNIDRINAQLPENNRKMIEAAESTKTFTTSADALSAALDYLGPKLADTSNKYGPWIAAQRKAAEVTEDEYLAIVRSSIAYAQSIQARRDQKDALYAMVSGFDALGTGQQLAAEKQEAFNTRLAGLHGIIPDIVGEMHAAADAARKYANDLVGTISLAAKLRPVDIDVRGGDKATGTAAELDKAGTALTGVLAIFGQIDNLGKGHDQAGSIVEGLIGKPGELNKAKELLDEGRISQTRFNMTMEAGNNILARSGEIESDLSVIRAKQLPLLDEADARYAKLIDDIAHMSAEQATATLGFMDANESMKAQNALALAAAAANTEVGSTARTAAEEIIAGAVAADPVLEAMLTQIGLVARDHEGNLVVNFDNADTLKSSTDALTNAILALTSALNGIPPNVNVEITAQDYASGVAQYVADVMAGLNGTSVSTTIYMDYVKRGDGTGMYNGGTVTAMANGGMVLPGSITGRRRDPFDAFSMAGITGGRGDLVGEAGPELVNLPVGSQVTPSGASRARMQSWLGINDGNHSSAPPIDYGQMKRAMSEAFFQAMSRFENSRPNYVTSGGSFNDAFDSAYRARLFGGR